MPNIEDKLNKFKFRGLDRNEQEALWRGIVTAKTASRSPLSFTIALKPMTALIVALAVLFTGTGVVAASDAAKPGDALFGIDLAVERLRLSLAGDDSRNELARTFAQERLEEIQKLRDDDSDEDDDNGSSTDASARVVTEIEADVFKNETVVKLEINDRKFGFVTSAKTREAIVAEIVAKYDLKKETVEALLVLEVEDRESRADDKTFLNSQTRAEKNISLDDKEKRDVEVSLNQVLRILDEDTSTSSAELRAALRGILEASVTGKIQFESEGDKMELKFKNGSIELKVKTEDDSDDDAEDENASSSDDDSDNRFRVRLSGSVDDSDDDQDKDRDDDRSASSSDDDDKDDDRNASGSDDDADDDSDNDDDNDEDKDEDEDKSGSDDDKDEEDDNDTEVDVKIKL